MGKPEETPLPQGTRTVEAVQGHWLLARLGKRVLRPGGAALTRAMLSDANVPGSDVVELAPGLGRTAAELIALAPKSYVGIDADPDAVARVGAVVGSAGHCLNGDAADTGLPGESADVVVGEAMLTMQTDRGKSAIISEVARVLRPGGRYAIHELALQPDDIDPEIATEIRQDLARSIKVNARPLTVAEWTELLTGAGLHVESIRTAPMALLQIRRNIDDEGIRGVAKILWNVLRMPRARKRVLAMRKTFRAHKDSLIAVSVVAKKTDGSQR